MVKDEIRDILARNFDNTSKNSEVCDEICKIVEGYRQQIIKLLVNEDLKWLAEII